MTASKIEWTDRSDWNPIRGCTRVSPGCGGPGKAGGCYAESMAARFSRPGMWGHGYAEMVRGEARWTGKVELQEDRLLLPLSWKKPAKVFASSTSDFFHEALSDADIDRLFAVMALCPQHTFQVLTKRAARMREYLAPARAHPVGLEALSLTFEAHARGMSDVGKGVILQGDIAHLQVWPLPNVWLGVSAERQQEADERIPELLNTPAAIRFVSAEPLLGPIDMRRFFLSDEDRDEVEALDRRAMAGRLSEGAHRALEEQQSTAQRSGVGVDWLIAGGESGRYARPMHPDWARSLRDQCAAAGVPFFFKQWGEWAPFFYRDDGEPKRSHDFGDARVHRIGKANTGNALDNVEHRAFPRSLGAL